MPAWWAVASPSATPGQQLRHILPAHLSRLRPGFEGTPVDEFGHQILPAFKLAHIVDREDVRVIQRRRHLRFLLKAAACGGVGQFVGRNLMATGRFSLVSCARTTTPMPPSPMGASMRYVPSWNPATSGVTVESLPSVISINNVYRHPPPETAA